MSPSNAWTVSDHLLANLVDQFSALLFGLGGGKGNRPKPVLRPGQIDESVQTEAHKGLPMTIEEMDEFRKNSGWAPTEQPAP